METQVCIGYALLITFYVFDYNFEYSSGVFLLITNEQMLLYIVAYTCLGVVIDCQATIERSGCISRGIDCSSS